MAAEIQADDAVAESTIGLFETELIERRGPWKTVEQVDRINHRRLHSTGGDIPPAELEAAHYRQRRLIRSRCAQARSTPDTPARCTR